MGHNQRSHTFAMCRVYCVLVTDAWLGLHLVPSHRMRPLCLGIKTQGLPSHTDIVPALQSVRCPIRATIGWPCLPGKRAVPAQLLPDPCAHTALMRTTPSLSCMIAAGGPVTYCPANCAACWSPTTCYQCADGFILQPSGGVCGGLGVQAER